MAHHASPPMGYPPPSHRSEKPKKELGKKLAILGAFIISNVASCTAGGLFFAASDALNEASEQQQRTTVTFTADPPKAPQSEKPKSEAKTADSEQVTEIGPGTYVVGAEIKPGYYKTKGPDEDGICYWARLKDLSGGLNSIINNGIAEGPTTIQILRTDKAFETRGCQPWVPVKIS